MEMRINVRVDPRVKVTLPCHNYVYYGTVLRAIDEVRVAIQVSAHNRG
jgi:hypothetical protein